MNDENQRPSAESLLARLRAGERARLRVYIGAAAGVGKTYQMLEDAHALKRQGVDLVAAMIETHGRAETAALLGELERVPMRRIEYRGVTLEEMDVEAVIARKPAIAVVDELAHTNVPGSKNRKRYEDVLDLLNAGISVITAVNIQHLESLNDAVARTTGVRVRETVPDHVLRRADEVVNVDVSVDTLRTRLRQGKIYGVEKIEQSLNNFFRKGNLSTLRELALRQVAQDQAAKAQDYREREGLEKAVIPEKVMVAMASRGSAKKLLRVGSRMAGRLANDWYAVYVETPNEEPGRIKPPDYAALQENIRFAEELGAKVVKLSGRRVADALIKFARGEGITHVIFGQSARSRWDILVHGSVINRFLSEVRDATVQVVPLEDAGGNKREVSSQLPVAEEEAATVPPLAVDGSERAFRLRTTPMRDTENHLLGAVTLLEDITHLREIDLIKSDFIATASHELRTPLTSVQMGVHLLLEGAAGELTDKQQEVLAACREDCERLEKLMRDLLDLSKLEAGESRPQLAPVRAKDLVLESAERLRAQVEANNIKLKTDAPPDLPHVLADRAQIGRVIINLVTNALRHTERGGEIEIGAERRDGGIVVSVRDTGRGIPPEYLPHIFDKFVQVPDAPTGGAGLGLAISKSIVEAHGGQLGVQSEVGRGTTLTFTLPAADGSSQASPVPTKTQS